MKVYKDLYKQIISLENLFLAWDGFRHGKSGKPDVMRFERHLEENIFALRRDLKSGRYRHGSYRAFYIQDPKQRLIHKATARDRVLHHAVFSILNPIFEPTFIANSFSCRVGKGTHRGVRTLAKILRQVSQNHTVSCFALKCDIHKFFASVDHEILLTILTRRIKDQHTIELLKSIIYSFNGGSQIGKGLPIGNLTSQLFANIYMNEFDQFVKHELRIKYYVRYTDDFIIADKNAIYLEILLPEIQSFLHKGLSLKLHLIKITIRKYNSGIDFLGYVIFPHHILLRTKTKNRMLKRANQANLASYLGICSHTDSYKLKRILLSELW